MATLKVTNIKNESFAGDQLYLKSDGKIGIGTTDPDAPLTIHNSADPEIRFGYSASQDHRISWDSSKVFIHADPDDANGSSALSLSVDGTSRLYIKDSGNIGIGRTDPGHKLAILGGASSQLEIKGTEADFWLTSTGGGSDKAWRILGSTGGSTHRFRIYDNANGREPFYIDNDGVSHFGGDVKVLTGDVQMGNGRGMNFSTTSDAGGMTSETFDDYEEGTWTPTITFGGGSTGLSISKQTGYYVKIGRLVNVGGTLILDNKGSSTGAAELGGLPFTIGNNDASTSAEGGGYLTYWINMATDKVDWTLRGGNNTTKADIVVNRSGGHTQNESSTDADMTSTTSIRFVMTYQT